MIAIKKKDGSVIKAKKERIHIDIIIKEDLELRDVESCGLVNEEGIYCVKYIPCN